MSKSNNSQYEKLRKRLEEELSLLKSSSENYDFDWFLRGQSFKDDSPPSISSSNANGTLSTPVSNKLPPLTPLKSPSLANSPNSKSKPTTKTSEDFLVSLSRSKTADAKLISSNSNTISRTSTNGSSNGLHKTATNVDYSDIGVSRNKRVLPSSATIFNPQPIPAPQKKKSFFKKLFGSSKDDHTKSSVSPSPSLSPSSRTLLTSKSRSTSLSDSSLKDPVSKDIPSSTLVSPAPSKSPSIPNEEIEVQSSPSVKASVPSIASQKDPSQDPSTPSLADQYKELDPELSIYLDEIEQSNVEQSNQIAERDEKIYNHIFSPAGIDSIKYSDDEIPPHPDKPSLPSAISMRPKYGKDPIEKELFLKYKKQKEEQEREREKEKESLGRFGSLLHKTRTNTIQLPSTDRENSMYTGILNESEDTPPFSFEPLNYPKPPVKVDKRPPLKTFSELKKMKKVAFSTTTFVTDPPQQIPSRNPRKGNVEICSNGELIIHKIDPQEKLNSATGIVVGGSGHLKLLPQEERDGSQKSNDHNLKIDDVPVHPSVSMSKTDSTASIGSLDQTIKKDDRILAAKKAREQHLDNETINSQKENLKIDKPMVRRKRHNMEKPVVTLRLDELYTRCCHLREILPIPAALKQIPKGSTDPIPYLQLRNPRPSMIEILSFTDFIRIAPIICISFDGVSLTHEMWRIVLSSLLYKRYLEKLSLRNTPIDEEGWKMLSMFLSMNKCLKKIDLTQCPNLDVNTQKIKKKTVVNDNRMVCNVYNRSDRNWSLITASIIYRGGIEEIILTGCQIPDLRIFSNLLNLALVKTNKIGLAYNNLTLNHYQIICEWMKNNENLNGIDLAFNDLSSNLKPLNDYFKSHLNSSLMMLSLNSCNLIDCAETELFFNLLSKLPNLLYLDLSANKKLFTLKSSNKISSNITFFSRLSRLNLDNNDFSETLLIKILGDISFLGNLNYLSILGNSFNNLIADALCKTIKNSKTIYSVKFDDTLIDSKHKEMIGLLTIKNVESQLYKTEGDVNGTKTSFIDMLLKDSKADFKKELGLSENESFTDTMYKLIQNDDDLDDERIKKFIKLLKFMRFQLFSLISELVNKKLKNELSIEGKEMLIRLISMIHSIDRGLELINNEKLADLKNSKVNLKDYHKLFDKSFERDEPDSSKTVANSNETPVHLNEAESIKQRILSTSDPYDLLSMLKLCKKKKISIDDLFARSVGRKLATLADAKSKNSAEHDVDDDDDISIDSFEGVDEDLAVDEEPDKISKIYDEILCDMVKEIE